MQGPLAIAFYVAITGVFVILGLGLWNLTRKDENQPSRSNRLMRLRVIMQFIAILLLAALGWYAGVFR